MRKKSKRRAFAAACLAALTYLVALIGGERSAAAEPVKLPVVMYHQLCKDDARAGDYVLPLWQLEADLRWLRENGYETVSVRRLLDWVDGRGALPEKPCMITFDDGYETTGVWAAPLLEKYGFCAVAGVIGSVAQQYTDAPDDTLAYAHLDWNELEELSRGGVLELQYHSWDMRRRGARKGCNRMRGESEAAYRAALEGDLQRFREAAEAHGVALAPAAAYPFGAYCALTEEILRSSGVRVGFSCTEKVNRLTGGADELFSLGRFNRPWGKSSEDFFAVWEKE